MMIRMSLSSFEFLGVKDPLLGLEWSQFLLYSLKWYSFVDESYQKIVPHSLKCQPYKHFSDCLNAQATIKSYSIIL